eukprot:evm.model.NODE_32286_length_32794_cov_31.879429.3
MPPTKVEEAEKMAVEGIFGIIQDVVKLVEDLPQGSGEAELLGGHIRAVSDELEKFLEDVPLSSAATGKAGFFGDHHEDTFDDFTGKALAG